MEKKPLMNLQNSGVLQAKFTAFTFEQNNVVTTRRMEQMFTTRSQPENLQAFDLMREVLIEKLAENEN